MKHAKGYWLGLACLAMFVFILSTGMVLAEGPGGADTAAAQDISFAGPIQTITAIPGIWQIAGREVVVSERTRITPVGS